MLLLLGLTLPSGNTETDRLGLSLTARKRIPSTGTWARSPLLRQNIRKAVRLTTPTTFHHSDENDVRRTQLFGIPPDDTALTASNSFFVSKRNYSRSCSVYRCGCCGLTFSPTDENDSSWDWKRLTFLGYKFRHKEYSTVSGQTDRQRTAECHSLRLSFGRLYAFSYPTCRSSLLHY